MKLVVDYRHELHNFPRVSYLSYLSLNLNFMDHSPGLRKVIDTLELHKELGYVEVLSG